MIVNFKEKVPEFGISTYENKATTTKSPYEIFKDQQKSKRTIFFEMKCCCSDPCCKNEISFYYNGLDHYASSKNLGSDKEVSINPCDGKEEGRANNVMWNPTEENVAQFIAFSETAREAIVFKQELLRGLYAELQVRIKGYDEIRIMVRKEDEEFRFILFEIPNTFTKVPLLYESKSYRECLGVIATLPSDTDTTEIKNAHADMRNPFFQPITEWVNRLGEENDLKITVKNIWVMPE